MAGVFSASYLPCPIQSIGVDLQVVKDNSLLTRIRSSTAAEGVKIMVSVTKGGVWLVRVVRNIHPQVENCIVVDGENRIILDSEESLLIRLYHRSLSMCGDKKCPEIKISEVLEIKTTYKYHVNPCR